MSAEGQFDRLFSPLEVGPMQVPNRICETTNTIGAGRHDGLADDMFIAHHHAKAAGGTGWIGSESWLLNSPLPAEAADEFFPGAAAVRMPVYMFPDFVERHLRFAEAIHAEGSVVVSQLTHLSSTLAPSSVPGSDAYDWIPHTLDEAEIDYIIGTYALAAAQFEAGGADGIEIHCAHETLPHLFLSPATNKRNDRWGGTALGRIRFVTEILSRVRDQIGDRLALGIRISGFETRQGGYSLFEMREMITAIAECGELDFVNVDVGSHWGAISYVQPSYFEHAQYAEVGKAVKADVEPVPVLFSGRVNDPVVAERLLESRVCDLVGMTRAGIADPEFPKKARSGRLMEMRRCIGCNRCIGEAIQSYAPSLLRRAYCSINPTVGNELLWKAQFRPARNPGRVVVIGGGAAGLEAARVAAMRGHEVILLERNTELGGQVRLASKAPGRDSFEDFIYFQENELERLGVDVRLDEEIGPEGVSALKPIAVVCATGSLPIGADVAGSDQPHVVLGWDILAGRAEVGDRVAVVSREDHMETPNVADYLAERGHEVDVIHQWTAIGREVDRYTIGTVMRRLESHGVRIHPGLRLGAIAGGKLDLVSSYSAEPVTLGDFDSVAVVYGSAPDTRLYGALKETVDRLFLIGSAWVPRQIAEATQHGMKAGLEV